MRIINCRTISSPAGRNNEDLVFASRKSAWLLDGATGLSGVHIDGFQSDASWFVHEWDSYLRQVLPDDEQRESNGRLDKIVLRGIDVIKGKYAAAAGAGVFSDPLALPSSCICLVRLTGSRLEYFILGDCLLIVSGRSSGQNGILSITDNSVGRFDSEAVKALHSVQVEEGLSLLDARSRIMPLLQGNRKRKNKPDGYWILEFDGEAVRHAVSGTIDVNPGSRVMLMSDGFTRLMDVFACYGSPGGLLDAAVSEGPEQLVNRLRKMEKDDPEGIMFPRLKKSDDASCILLELGD